MHTSTVSRLLASIALLTGLTTVAPPTALAADPDALESARQLVLEHPLEWQPCEDDAMAVDDPEMGPAECAVLTVPLDYAHPDAGTIGIAVARRRATDPAARIGSLLFNPGGPGAVATPIVRTPFVFKQLFPAEIRRHFDIVAFDPRGTAEPSLLDCDLPPSLEYYPDSPLDTDDGWAAHIEHARAVATRCAETAGWLLPYIGVVDVVRDVEMLRLALGEEQISYLGYSGGTLIGAYYVDEFPLSVRAAVLDSAVNPAQDAVTIIRDSAAGFEHMLQGFLAACAADRSCPFYSNGDPADALRRIIQRVRTDPPIVTVEDGSRVPVTLQGLRRSLDPITATAHWYEMAVALQAAAEGDYSQLVNRTGPRFQFQLAFTAIECLDTPLPRDLDVLRALADELAATTTLGDGTGIGLTELLPCAFWPAPATRPVEALHGRGAPPVLVAQNQGDGQTPYAWGPGVAGQLESAVLLTTTAWGHVAQLNSTCAAMLMTEYLLTLRTPAPGATCPATPQPRLWQPAGPPPDVIGALAAG